MRRSCGLLSLGLALGVLTLLVGCAAGAKYTEANPAGFWLGLWHGLICPVAFVVSLFSDTAAIYESANTGHLYDLGFVLGAMLVFGGGGSGACSTKRRRKDDREWEQVADKAKAKILRRLDEWSKDEQGDFEQRVERKLRRTINDWAEKDD